MEEYACPVKTLLVEPILLQIVFGGFGISLKDCRWVFVGGLLASVFAITFHGWFAVGVGAPHIFH